MGPGAAGRDQLVAEGAREWDVGEGATLAGVMQVAELPAAELEHRPSEARLRRHFDALPVTNLAHQRVDGDGAVEPRILE
jgi:hypothetical protein